MPNTNRNTQKIKKIKFDKKQCFPGPKDILVNKEECKSISNKECGKKVYLENGNYYYCRNYRPIIGKRGCDYLSTTNKRQGLCNNQELIKKVLSRNRDIASTSQTNQFTTKNQAELASRLTEIKKLGYNKKIFDQILSPLAENAEFLTAKQRNDLKSKLLVEAIDEEVTNKKAKKELKKLEDKYFEIEIKKRLESLKQGGKSKSKKSKKSKKYKKSKKRKTRKHKYGGSRSPSRSRSRSPSRSRSKSQSRSRSPRSLSPSTRKTKKIRGQYSSPVKREPKTHVIFEGEDEFDRKQEILDSPSTFVGDKISFFGNNQLNHWSGDIVLINGIKRLVNIEYPYDY